MCIYLQVFDIVGWGWSGAVMFQQLCRNCHITELQILSHVNLWHLNLRCWGFTNVYGIGNIEFFNLQFVKE